MISEHFRQNIQPLRRMPGQPSRPSWELNGDGSGKSKSPGVFGCVPLGLGSYTPLVCSEMPWLENWVHRKHKHRSFEWNTERNWLELKATRFQKRFWKQLVIVIFTRETTEPNLTRLAMLPISDALLPSFSVLLLWLFFKLHELNARVTFTWRHLHPRLFWSLLLFSLGNYFLCSPSL